MVILFRKLFTAERTNEVQDRNSYFFYQHQKVYDFCKKWTKDRTVLEIGSGGGFGTYNISRSAESIVGIDNDAHAVRQSQSLYKNDNLTYVHSDFRSYFPTRQFDVIISLQVFEHIKEPSIFFDAVKRLLSKNGTLIISTPNGLKQSFNENPYHYKEYPSEELSTLFNRHFKLVTLYGLHGDKTIMSLEKKRRNLVLRLFQLDFLHIRALVPRKIRQVMFDFFALIMRALLGQNSKISNQFTTNNFSISRKSLDKSLDFIVVCN